MQSDIEVLYGCIDEEINKVQDVVNRNKIRAVFTSALQKLNALKIDALVKFQESLRNNFSE